VGVVSRIAGHALMAGAFFFGLQYFVLGEGLQTSVIWGLIGGGAAATLAWMQHRRGR
jgi:hypothetical protein